MSDANIRNQVWGAVDPTGENRDLINAAIHGGPDAPVWLRRVGADVDEAWAQLATAALTRRVVVEEVATAIQVLGPRGWAVLSMDKETVVQAIRLVGAGEGDEADGLLAEQWEGNGAWRLKQVCNRVRSMAAADEETNRLFRERARLLTLAKEHHLAGRYDASIPQLQAQLEGIAIDVTGGGKFFTKGTQKADLIDPTQLVSIEAGLAALQALYGQDVKETQTDGSLSRHGVAHGRDLAYDTRVNSAKTWSVVDALVDWALPRARDLADARSADRQTENAGSEEFDEDGRRVDDREIAETRDMLRVLSTSAMGWHRQGGAFRDDLVGGVYDAPDFAKLGLPVEHGTEQRVREDGDEVMYWRETASGWVLGLALDVQGDTFGEYLYAGPRPPAGLPSEGAHGWGGLFETPPDWA